MQDSWGRGQSCLMQHAGCASSATARTPTPELQCRCAYSPPPPHTHTSEVALRQMRVYPPPPPSHTITHLKLPCLYRASPLSLRKAGWRSATSTLSAISLSEPLSVFLYSRISSSRFSLMSGKHQRGWERRAQRWGGRAQSDALLVVPPGGRRRPTAQWGEG